MYQTLRSLHDKRRDKTLSIQVNYIILNEFPVTVIKMDIIVHKSTEITLIKQSKDEYVLRFPRLRPLVDLVGFNFMNYSLLV